MYALLLHPPLPHAARLRALGLWTVVALSACAPAEEPVGTGAGGGSGASDGEDGDPSPWDSGLWGDPGEAASPQYTAEELGVLLAAHAEFFADVSPHKLMPDYLSLMGSGDGECPGVEVAFGDNGTTCTSESDYTYSGVARWYSGELGGGSERSRTYEGFTLADFVYSTPAGERYVGSGSSERSEYTTDGIVDEWHLYISGSWIYAPSDTPWLAQGLSSTARAVVLNGGDAPHELQLSGAWGSGEYAISFERLVFGDPSCPGVPTEGTVRLRQPDSSWNYLTAQGDCSACFDVSWQEEQDLGETCVDLTAWRDSLVGLAEMAVLP